jgi:hypothetical protein
MKCHVLEPFKVKTSQGEKELQTGQIITIPRDKAMKLIAEGKITPADLVAYRVFSELLQAYLWVVFDPGDIKALRAQGIIEPAYTGQDIEQLKKFPKAALKTVHAAKEVFPIATVEEVLKEGGLNEKRYKAK